MTYFNIKIFFVCFDRKKFHQIRPDWHHRYRDGPQSGHAACFGSAGGPAHSGTEKKGDAALTSSSLNCWSQQDVSAQEQRTTSNLSLQETWLWGVFWSRDCSQKILLGLLWDSFFVLFHLLNTDFFFLFVFCKLFHPIVCQVSVLLRFRIASAILKQLEDGVSSERFGTGSGAAFQSCPALWAQASH